MPELPEVETARRLLARWTRGAIVQRAKVVDGTNVYAVAPGAPRSIAKALAGQRVVAVERRGKWLRMTFGPDLLLFSHLGMTGRWTTSALDPPADARRVAPWERFRLEVEHRGRARVVRYIDPRRFGRLVLAREDIAAWGELGPDPLVDGVRVARFAEALRQRRRTIKEVLLDQSVLAGVGNIQANEALWKARIHPARRSDALEPAEVRALAAALRWTIARTLRDLAKDGDEPGYVGDAGGENPFVVYARAGESCPRGNGTIVRVTLGGRGTFFCPGCQERPRRLARARAAT